MTARRRVLAAVTAVALTLAGLTAAAACRSGRGAGGRPSRPPAAAPPAAAFYQPPNPLPYGSPGELIRSQPYPAPDGYRAWRILYHSRDERGGDRAVSGFVVIGNAPVPRGGRPVVAAGHSVTGLSGQCAPSMADRVPAAVARAAKVFAAGAAYVFTDYPGLGTPGSHPYLVGEVTARSILDAARAAARVPGVQAGPDVIVTGDTMGAPAALFAGQIAHGYAPELHLLGAAVGTPVVRLPQLLAHVVGATPYGVEFLLEAMAGYDGVTPAANLSAMLTPKGLADLNLLNTECSDRFAQDTAGQRVTEVFRSDPLRTSPWSDAFTAASPAPVRISAPILITQAVRDTNGGGDVLYPIDLTTGFVQDICRQRDTVQYRTYPKLPHDGPAGATAADPDIVQWMLDRFAGRPTPSTCG